MGLIFLLVLIGLGVFIYKKITNSKNYNLYLFIAIIFAMIITFVVLLAIFKYLLIFLLPIVGIYLYLKFYRKKQPTD